MTMEITETINFRAGTEKDADAIIALNRESEAATSPMDEARFAELYAMASLMIVGEREGQVIGFLMGFVSGIDLDGLNYRWFDTRLKRFFYIDRIVIDAACRGEGVGQRIYSEVRQWARDQGLLWLAAEMNLDPPNLRSLKFHRRNGFMEIGTQKLPDNKIVSMQIRRLDES